MPESSSVNIDAPAKHGLASAVKDWIKNHDERWSFILIYVGAAIVLSIYANLFWVVVLMLIHYMLEIWRHMVIEDQKPFLTALWHVKLDIALILFAIVVSLYAEVVMAALGIGQVARAGQAVRSAQMITRFAIIERGLRIFFLTIDDVARVGMIIWKIIKGKNGKKTEQELEDARHLLQEEEEQLHPDYAEGGLSKGDIFSLSFGGLCLMLILISPWAAGIGISGAVEIILRDLSP